MIHQEIKQENCHVAETEDFLKNLFPVNADVINKVYKALVKSKVYDVRESRWNGFPEKEGAQKEEAFYKPFVDAAESIRKAAPDETIQLHCQWIDRHSKAPTSRDETAALIRPDILSVLGMRDNDKLNELIDACENEVRLPI